MADDIGIKNGHAARMRYTRFRQAQEGEVPTGRKGRAGTSSAKERRGTKKAARAKKEKKAEEEEDGEEETADVKTENFDTNAGEVDAEGEVDAYGEVDETYDGTNDAGLVSIKQEATIKDEPTDEEEISFPESSSDDYDGPLLFGGNGGRYNSEPASVQVCAFCGDIGNAVADVSDFGSRNVVVEHHNCCSGPKNPTLDYEWMDYIDGPDSTNYN